MNATSRLLVASQLAVLVCLGCGGASPPATAAAPRRTACGAGTVSHALGEYVEDATATIAHLKTSYAARAGMTADEIAAEVAKAPRVHVRVAAASVDFEERHCCVSRVLHDTDVQVTFDVSCGSKGEYRYTFLERPDGKLLFVSDSQPGRPETPDNPGFEAIRYEEVVLAPAKRAAPP